MEGFFSKKETSSKTRPGGKMYTCHGCGLHKTCKSPFMKPYGNFKKKILNIGEAPGEVEDNTGKPWQGRAGKLLQLTYKGLGIDLFDDCLNINAVSCRPTDKEGRNRTPSNFEVENCRKRVLHTIEEYKPRVIILLGNPALSSLIGHRWKRDLGGINKWRGWNIPDQDFNAWVCPTFHPSYIQRVLENSDDTSVEFVLWKRDLGRAFQRTGIHIQHYVEPEIEIIEDLSILKKIYSHTIAFDYETTGLKPHKKGHRVVCASVADTENHAYAFMMPNSRKEKQPFIDLLRNPEIRKVAQNMKYEDTWTDVRLNTEVVNWWWDTMLATHIMDNRPGITSLKFQVFVQFGIPDYESEVSQYLSAGDSKDGNSINNIFKLLTKPKGAYYLLKYCGLDSVYELRLANLQHSDILPF
jgi:uracil-DNA glycosylase